MHHFPFIKKKLPQTTLKYVYVLLRVRNWFIYFLKLYLGGRVGKSKQTTNSFPSNCTAPALDSHTNITRTLTIKWQVGGL